MPKDNQKKTPSADEIIEALALEMGVDEGGLAPKKPIQPPPPPTSPPSVKSAAPLQVDEIITTPPSEIPEEPKLAPPPAETTPRSEPSRQVKGPSPKEAEPHLGVHGLDEIFRLEDMGEEPLEPLTAEDFDDEELLARAGNPTSRMVIRLLIVLIITVIGLSVAYMLVPADKRQDVWPLLQGEDIQTERQLRREQEEERIRQEWLAQQPKYGRLSVATRPAYGLVRVHGQPEYVRHPTRESTLVETRSPTGFENLDVREHHIVYITLPNFQERRIELFPFDHENTMWFQDQDTGHYYLELNEILDPRPELTEELVARLTPSSMIPELTGQITVRTDPPGAVVYYNNTLLVGEDGEPLTTPVTFTDYPPRPRTEAEIQRDRELAEQSPEGEQAEQPEEPQRRPVALTVRGVPIRVELEGYMPVATGVYSHMFSCELNAEAAVEAPFWEQCIYTYDTGVIQLLTPEQFEPEEPAEGTGAGAAQSDSVISG